MPEPPFELRIAPATAEQTPIILRFVRALAEYEKLAHEVQADEELLRKWLFSESPVAEVILAFRGGVPAGFALFFTTFSTFLARPGLYLEDLFVDPDSRGLGIGKALLVYLARLARERDYGRVEWSVLKWNQPAIEFYESLGAVPLEEWTFYRLTGQALLDLAR